MRPDRRLLLLGLLLLAGCGDRGAQPPVPSGAEADLARLVGWMTGSFSSAKQAAANPEYRDVRLHVVRVWPGRTDGAWLYVEQAIASALDRPYRQRVYRVRHVGLDLFESQVYELGDPERHVGAWKAAAPLEGLAPESLSLKPGCAVILRRGDDGTFSGSTLGSACGSDFQGAAYATSEVTVTAAGLVSWDRGYDAAGAQVWGATAGGYRFDRAD